MRLLPASKRILRVLDVCPWVPIDVLVALAAARTRVSVYQALARLREAELVEVRRVRLGPLAGDRPVGLWATTEQGRQALATAAPASPDQTIARAKLLLGAPDRRTRPAVGDLVRVAAARGLAALFVAESAPGQPLLLCAWEAPWTRSCLGAGGRLARLPAAAVIESIGKAGVPCMELVVVLPDLGTAPVVRAREMLRRLKEILADAYATGVGGLPRLLIVTTNLDGHGARGAAWRQLVQRTSQGAGLQPQPISLLEWQQVSAVLGGIRVPGGRGHPDVPGYRQSHPRGRMRREDQVLDVLGRHPFLTVEQIADLLALGPHRVRVLRGSLVARGLVHVISPAELQEARSGIGSGGSRGVDVAELTASGRRHLAKMLGLPAATAHRHHGLSVGSARNRRRVLQSLAHTFGANDVFVRLALAARAARARGADEALEDWRPAAACERRHCKPDGYGCYRVGAARYGFFVEYDRGTERAPQYAAKFAAYYAYRDSGQAARDYAGFPDVLFVTTSAAAEERIVAAAERAWARFGGAPLPVFVTTLDRVAFDRLGMLGPIWRQPSPASDGVPRCGYWLRGAVS